MITTPEQMREAAARDNDLIRRGDVTAIPLLGMTVTQIERAIRAIPIAPQPVAVTVKPLVWDYSPTSCLDCMCHDKFGLYQITDEFVLFAGHSTTGDKHFSIEQAQAAAQADYEARILSALTTHPADPLSDPRVKALVEALQHICDYIDTPSDSTISSLKGDLRFIHSRSIAALRAIGGEA